MPNAKAQMLVMLVELDDGSVSILDSGGGKHEAANAEELWAKTRALLGSGDLPALESAPGNGPKVSEKREREDLDAAFGTLGERLKQAAEAEYGAPLVAAASTVLAHTTKRASGILRKASRRTGPSLRFKRRAAG